MRFGRRGAAVHPGGEPSRPPSGLAWAAGAAVLFLAAAPPLFLIFASWRLRHVPWEIPPEWRVPAPDRRPGGLSLRYLGISGYEISDGKTVIVADPAVTRPTALELLKGPLRPDPGLEALWCPKADFILISHAHYDHAVDAPGVALRTGASIVGTRSALNLARSRGVPEARLIEAVPGAELRLGTFKVRIAAARHSKLFGREDLMIGVIAPEAGPLWFWQYRQDGSLSFRLEAGGASLWHHPSAVYEKGDLGGIPADTLILGVAGLDWTAERAAALLGEAAPKLVLPTHYDNFFQPLGKGLALLHIVDIHGARKAAAAFRADLPWVVLEPGQTMRVH